MDSLHATAFEETPSMRSIRPQIPEELQRVVSRCLRKQPGERYSEARMLAEDLRRIRLDTEAGLVRKTSWPQRIRDTWDELRHLRPSHYVWYGIGLVAALWALYLSLSKIGSGGVILLALASLYIYRHVRNRSHAVQERFVRRVSQIPEVVLIVLCGHQATVVVDRAVPQLYGRISNHLRACNRQLYFGEPITLSILDEVPPDQLKAMLASPGVQYVRETALR